MLKENCEALQTYVQQQVAKFEQYQITPDILLAGQPQPEDWDDLFAAGFKLIINMRSDSQRATIEAINAKAAGLQYLHLPLPVYELETEHLAVFGQAVQQATPYKTLIHCRTGSRVGLLWSLHRQVNQNWPQTEAEAELRAAGYDDDGLETFQFCSEDYFERIT